MAVLPDIDILDNTRPVRLTQTVKAGGCASKLAPGTLSTVLGRLPRQTHENLLVGFETADDAGVYRLNAHQALVQTVDFFTPMVDDPYTFGRVAATNALSDVYAMGGRAITALAMVCFPSDGDLHILDQIMRGGLRVMEEAGCVVMGGHSVRDHEIKFGYAVTGLVDPQRVFRNTGAEGGDALVFTKALGTGVITTALKQGRAQPEWVEAAVASMTTSNRLAAELAAATDSGVHAMTDVTGFGLMGHGRELAFGSGVRLVLDVDAIQVLPGALEAIDLGATPAGLLANRDYAECVVEEAPGAAVQDRRRAILYDPQTAGGLLISMEAVKAPAFVQQLQEAGYASARVIGSVERGKPGIVLT